MAIATASSLREGAMPGAVAPSNIRRRRTDGSSDNGSPATEDGDEAASFESSNAEKTGSDDESCNEDVDIAYYEDSCSEHGELDPASVLIRGRRTGKQALGQRVRKLVQELQRRQKQTQQKIAKSVNQRVRVPYMAQQERLVRRSRLMATKLRSGRSRAWRHKWVFALVQMDFILSAFLLGAQTSKFYLYYSAHWCLVIFCKTLNYRVNAQHYFLLDFCFFANAVVSAWIWLFPTSGLMYNAAEGVCGLLAISIVAFRNSCVPHDFVRISHAYVHYPAIVAMLSINMVCDGDLCTGKERGESSAWYVRTAEAWSIYLVWAVAYASVIFLLARKRIERKNRDTMYKYIAITLGIKEKLPQAMRPYSQLIFMMGHMTLFLSGSMWLFLPTSFKALALLMCILIFFHNGGRFYVDHFWKTYERNTLLYVDAAYSAMNQQAEAATDNVNGTNGTAAERGNMSEQDDEHTTLRSH